MSIRARFTKASADGLIRTGVEYNVNYQTSRQCLIELEAKGRGVLLYDRALYNAALERGEIIIFK